MATVLAYAETRSGELRAVSREVVSAARRLADELGAEVEAVALAPPGGTGAVEELVRYGADRLLVAEDDAFGRYHPGAAVRAVAGRAGETECAAVLFPASAQGKDLAPRVAARLDRSLATEVTELEVEDGSLVVTRPVYAGKGLLRLGFASRPALVSIRPNVFSPEERQGAGEVRTLEVDAAPGGARVRGFEATGGEKLDVAEARIVVSGGRGMGGPENWHLLEELVDAVGDRAALGASRAVVDAGWRPHAEQVGQTGKVVSPGLYFAIGISGAIQHLAGMRTSNVIVAVNKDPEAPIFDVADYGIVGDLFEILPRLTEEIRDLRRNGGQA